MGVAARPNKKVRQSAISLNWIGLRPDTGNNKENAMTQQHTWEAALEEAQVLFDKQNRDLNAAISRLHFAGNVPIEVDERILHALLASTTTGVVRIAQPSQSWLSGSRC